MCLEASLEENEALNERKEKVSVFDNFIIAINIMELDREKAR